MSQEKKIVYFDQASSSSPKAEGLGAAITAYFEAGGYNISRGHYPGAEEAAVSVLNVRRMLAQYFNFDSFRRVVFTNNITHSLNLVLKGFLRAGDEIITSSMEHNAVMRPLKQLSQQGVVVKIVQANEQGQIDPQDFAKELGPKTRAIVSTAASNVSGTTQDIFALGEIAKAAGIHFIVDSAQLAGHLAIDSESLSCSAFCFTGHKGFRGPQGIGGVLLREDLAGEIQALISGGTGSFSDSEDMPPHLPDRLEAGTPNLPGILGLGHAVSLKLKEKPFESFHKEATLLSSFLRGLEESIPADSYRICGLGLEGAEATLAFAKQHLAESANFATSLPPTMPLVSLDFKGRDNAELAYQLENRYGIMTRCGLHCAPRAHQSLNSFPQGTIRFSIGASNSEAEVAYVLSSLKELLS